MMRFLRSLFRQKGELVGWDRLGNSYFELKAGGGSKRWIRPSSGDSIASYDADRIPGTLVGPLFLTAKLLGGLGLHIKGASRPSQSQNPHPVVVSVARPIAHAKATCAVPFILV